MKYTVVQASYANDEYRYTVKDAANGNKRYYVVVNKKKDTITIPAFMGLQDTGGDENSVFFFAKMCSMISKITGENTRRS